MVDISGSLARQSWLVAAVCLVADLGTFLILGPPLTRWDALVVVALAVVADLALAASARLSWLVACGHAALAVLAPLLLCACTGGVRVPNSAGILVAGYRAGAWLRTPRALLTLAVMFAGLTASYLLGGGRNAHDWRLLTANLLTSVALPWLVGRYTTARRAYVAELEKQEERKRRNEREAVERAVADERSAIARDLHDVISHHVSAIGLHAGAARMGLPESGGATVHRSLTAVESASRSAMVDLRRLLDLLHGQEAGPGRRQPGLDNLDELLDGMRGAGLAVRLTTEGKPSAVPGSLDIALYRIAQEALTNALRHGEHGQVELVLTYRRTEVALTVTNPASATARHEERAHLGLSGIRQRVALFGGTATYGMLPDGAHWQVRVAFGIEPAGGQE
ncbi:sensor histidine kinase [Amycolatopsis minnesotensis]|uniref:histidine kinase n=1 Tax=Amycolatopsis minnesotensis TaxID=337894 RepID=A0ABN2SD72_9PSEU